MVNSTIYSGGFSLKCKKSIQSKKDWIDIKSPLETRVSFNSILSAEKPASDFMNFLRSFKVLFFMFSSIHFVFQTSE